ncbi:PREDICTED: uncharacterized protein LOC109462487 [Branchiostoma belcheri]|uniref:Uncharacterized protein LOC109462487 n=1 Tax=Branchiostoma belcheri TaxID=7741 RepID=A0A6P4XR99_BRABE|nr:PREDICTED: uncharacterized protein LOC109462487 [Branchiostoma belcheri]
MYKAFFLALLVGTVLAGDNGRLLRPLKGSSKKAGALREITWQSFHSSVVVAFQSSGASYLRDEMRAAYNDLKAKADAAKAAVPGCEQIVTSKLQTSCVSCVVHQLQSAFNDPATSSVLNVEGIGSEVEAFADGTLASVSNDMNLAAGTVWSGVQSAANVIVDAGEEFLNADGDVVDAAGNLVSNVDDTVGGAIDSIGDAIGGIFGGGLGRRKRAVRAESQREQACFLFADPSACHTSCDKSYLKSTYCPTLIAAEAALNTSQQQNGWITNLPQQHDLIIREITVNSNGVIWGPGASAGYFYMAVVEATIFGYDMMFAVRSPISPQDHVQGGRVLAEQALDIFKLYHPFTGN